MPIVIRFTSLLLLLYVVSSACGQLPIEEARQMPLGTTVTIRGVVTNGGELGTIRYIQDATGGLPAFPGSGSVPGFSANVQRGDSVLVTGVLFDFNGLLELSPVTGYTVLGQQVTLPEPPAISLDQVSKDIESQLVRISGVRFQEQGFFQGNQTYWIVDDLGYSQPVFVRSGHPLVGTPIVSDTMDLVAIISWFNGIQLLPRDQEDLMPVSGLFFTRFIRQTDLSPTSVSLEWSTNLPTKARILYSGPEGEQLADTILQYKTNHAHTIGGLEPAGFYEVQVIAERSYNTSSGVSRWMSTASQLPGEVRVYFNRSTDPSFSTGPLPLTTSGDEVMDAFLQMIATAEESIDVSIYNINSTAIVQALSQAYNQGVRVRLIASSATANTALIPSPPFPVLYGNNSGLMHNKFVIIDAGIPEKASVFTGSMNFTTQQIYTAYNNMVLVRDWPLAKAYTIEFDEMWGSVGEMPNESAALFGNNKQDNTPKLFKPDGEWIELYFSPSDNTNGAILGTLEEANEDILFALLTFTKTDLAAMIAHRFHDGVDVRGIIDNINDNGSEYNFLREQGVPVKDHVPSSIFHHKYAVVDQQKVITGSHNWSNAANTVNDENTLIFHSATIANIFRQEFEKRWAELPDLTSVLTEAPPMLEIINLIRQDGYLMVQVASNVDRQTLWQLYDFSGREAGSVQQYLVAGANWLQLPWQLPMGGMYALTVMGEDGSFAVRKVMGL